MLLFLELDLGGRANLEDGNAAGHLGETLLEFLAVVVGIGVFDLSLDLVDSALDVGFVASALDDRRLILGDNHALGGAEQIECGVLQLETDVFADDLPTGEDGDVLQHRLAALAEARGLDGNRLERATDLVDDERGECLPLDVFGNDQERLTRLHDFLKHRHEIAYRTDL